MLLDAAETLLVSGSMTLLILKLLEY